MVLRSMAVMLTMAATAVAQQRGVPSPPEHPGAAQHQQQSGAIDPQNREQMDQRTGLQTDRPSQQVDRQSGQQMERRAGQQVDRKLAQLLLIVNQGEIAVSQFAQEKASSDSVKEFAQSMVREHSELSEKLQQISFGPQVGQQSQTGALRSGTAGQRPETPMRSETTQRSETAQRRTTTAGSATAQRSETQRRSVTDQQQPGAAAGMAGDPLLAILHEAGQRCMQLTQQELSRHQGADFDKAYMGQQIVAHVDALAKLQTFESHASGQLQQIVSQAAQSTEQHLEHARTIMKQLDTQAASTAQRSGEQTRQ